MMSPTFFGEINELDSRAVWYSDEEDSSADEMMDEFVVDKTSHQFKAKNHESVIDAIQFDYCSLVQGDLPVISDCLISLSSHAKYKNFRINDDSNIRQLGQFGSIGKTFLLESDKKQYSLWIMFDCTHRFVSGYMVNYFVQIFTKRLSSLFKFSKESQIIILSQQFSIGEHLEYLTNSPTIKQPFRGKTILPPNLIKNPFESALFEYSTLRFKLATIVCLPDPKNCWFNSQAEWPSLNKIIINQRLEDYSLDQTLIFT